MNTNKIRFPMASILFILTFIPNISTILIALSAILSLSVPVQYWILDIWGIISLILPLVVGILLIMKRRGIGLAVVFAIQAINTLINGIMFSELNGFLSVLLLVCKDVLMLFIILANCDIQYINLDYEKLINISKKIWFLPGLISAALSIGNIFVGISDISGGITSLLISTLRVAAILMLGKWLVDPYKKLEENLLEDGSVVSCDEGYCGLGKHIVLCLFTCGIWYLIWIYRTTKFLNKAPNAVQQNPANKLLLCIFVPFYQIYWFYNQGQRIDAMSKQKKLNNSDMATLCLILGIFIPIVACILMQDRINALCTTKTVAAEKETEDDSTTEKLVRYKELLEDGVITQEEFDAKKKQLLGL